MFNISDRSYRLIIIVIIILIVLSINKLYTMAPESIGLETIFVLGLILGIGFGSTFKD